ncbi:ATP-binding protein [Scytonema sp. NUACC26]|uniref:sensor histidine kinase n=1 Tax=Scytonema sp. NUACC26 TaxID=3140176 RepID=UPI0034DC86C3
MTLKPQASHPNIVKRAFHQLSIRQKIVVGYGLALGIAILGTTTGLGIGDRYYQKARYQMMVADEEGGLLSELQGTLLEIKSHQEEIVPLVKQPQMLQAANSKFLINLTKTEKLLAQLQEFSQTHSQKDLQAFLEKHKLIVTTYFQQCKPLLQQLGSNGTPEELREQSLIWEFYQNPAAIQFNQFIHELTKFTLSIREHQEQADVAQSQAATLQAHIIIGSILLSTALATLLAFYTSRTIAYPIKVVTAVAKQVTKEANFDLQAPVLTKDEVGELAIALNQLIQQVKKLLKEQQAETQARLIQSEKMCSLGRMLAGVAHEIINPVNFISGNLVHAKNYTTDLMTLLQTYKHEIPNPPISIQVLTEEIDLEFLEVDLPKLLTSIEFGAERTREIARSLKDFARLDEGDIQFVDIHTCLNSTLLILQNRLKKGINIIRNYGDIPHIPGYPGLLYQVFMNLLSNAIDALEEKTSKDPYFSPEITITTELGNLDLLTVQIGDNGSGISLENQSKIFETFFTTKPRGIGTGLGLAITYQIVVEKHGGKIACKSELDKGTEFTVFLPTNSKLSSSHP